MSRYNMYCICICWYMVLSSLKYQVYSRPSTFYVAWQDPVSLRSNYYLIKIFIRLCHHGILKRIDLIRRSAYYGRRTLIVQRNEKNYCFWKQKKKLKMNDINRLNKLKIRTNFSKDFDKKDLCLMNKRFFGEHWFFTIPINFWKMTEKTNEIDGKWMIFWEQAR